MRVITADLAGITFIYAGGIGALMRAHQAATDRGARFIIIGASDYVRQICTLAGVTTTWGMRPQVWPGPLHPHHTNHRPETSNDPPAATGARTADEVR